MVVSSVVVLLKLPFTYQYSVIASLSASVAVTSSVTLLLYTSALFGGLFQLTVGGKFTICIMLEFIGVPDWFCLSLGAYSTLKLSPFTKLLLLSMNSLLKNWRDLLKLMFISWAERAFLLILNSEMVQLQ